MATSDKRPGAQQQGGQQQGQQRLTDQQRAAAAEQQKALEREAQAEMDRKLQEIEDNPDLSEEERQRQTEQVQGQKGTPRGMGRAYEERPSGSDNVHGKASATKAGGDPVYSPVIGNPGEHNPAAGNYDYAIAAKLGNPNAVSQPLQSSDVAGGPRRAGAPKEKTEYPKRVVAIRKGEYGGIKEVGEEFDNDRNIEPYPENPTGWFRAVDEGEFEESRQRAVKKAEEREQDELRRKEAERAELDRRIRGI